MRGEGMYRIWYDSVAMHGITWFGTVEEAVQFAEGIGGKSRAAHHFKRVETVLGGEEVAVVLPLEYGAGLGRKD